MTSAMLVAAIVTFQSIRPDSGPNEQAAARKTQEIVWQQSGIEPMLNAYAQKNAPKELRWAVGNAAFVMKTVTDRQITVKWTFP